MDNIILITAGGIGARMRSSMPKQYMEINGIQVLGYVIDACQKSKHCDGIVVVADPKYHNQITSKYDVKVVENGKTLNASKKRGINFIKENYNCQKLVICDAVRPSITSNIIDHLFELLDCYDAVACAKKITDSLHCKNQWQVNREDFFLLFAPESFDFSLLESNFSEDSTITETIQQLPQETNVFFDFDVPYLEKITFPEDLIKFQSFLDNHIS